jgi:hypothetical protein
MATTTTPTHFQFYEVSKSEQEVLEMTTKAHKDMVQFNLKARLFYSYERKSFYDARAAANAKRLQIQLAKRWIEISKEVLAVADKREKAMKLANSSLAAAAEEAKPKAEAKAREAAVLHAMCEEAKQGMEAERKAMEASYGLRLKAQDAM